MGILSRVQDPEGQVVELTGERWEHIVRVHPELRDHRVAVLAAVQAPTARVPGRRPNESWYLLRDAGPSRWLHVVVAFEGGRGWIVTAYGRRRIS